MKLLKLLFGFSLNLGFISAAGAQTTLRINISTAQNSHQGVAIDTFPKETIRANRARMDQDDATGVAELRTKGMTVTENIDKSKFVAMLAPVNAEFERQFGKSNVDKIRDYKLKVRISATTLVALCAFSYYAFGCFLYGIQVRSATSKKKVGQGVIGFLP